MQQIKKRVFIGSSTESKEVADLIKENPVDTEGLVFIKECDGYEIIHT